MQGLPGVRDSRFCFFVVFFFFAGLPAKYIPPLAGGLSEELLGFGGPVRSQTGGTLECEGEVLADKGPGDFVVCFL